MLNRCNRKDVKINIPNYIRLFIRNLLSKETTNKDNSHLEGAGVRMYPEKKLSFNITYLLTCGVGVEFCDS